MTLLTDLAQRLLSYQRILIVSHVDPDGDTIGSALGLAWALRHLDREVHLTCQDRVPDDVAFLPGADDYRHTGIEDEQVLVAVDTSDVRRMGTIYDADVLGDRPLLVIDHHVTNAGFGTLNLIQDTASTAEVVLQVIDAMGVPLDATIATCLLTGLITDTQGFRTGNTTPEALAVAQRLIQAGVDLADITDQVFNRRSLDTLSVWGRALAAAELRHHVVWTELLLAWLPSGDSNGQLGSGLVNMLNSVREARIAVLFTEQADGLVDVSIRAKRGLNVAPVAVSFGGGGHPQAAGCQVRGDLSAVREAVLEALVGLVRQAQ